MSIESIVSELKHSKSGGHEVKEGVFGSNIGQIMVKRGVLGQI